jgi:hypothetical protein
LWPAVSILRKPAAAGLAALALLASGCGSSSSSTSPSRRSSSLVSIFEAQQQLLTSPAGTLDQLRRLGVGVVRVFLSWNSVAPNPLSDATPTGFTASSPGAYPAAGWAPYDAIVRAAKSRGIRVFFSVEGPAPLWTTGPGAPRRAPEGGAQWQPSPVDYGEFVHAVGARYSGSYAPAGAAPLPRVSMWSLWNEPNDGPQLAPQAIDNSTVEASAARYRSLVAAGWPALQATGHGSDTILIGELAPYGQSLGANVPGDFGEMVPLRFVRALYCVDGALHPLQGAAAAARGCPTTAAASKRFVAENPGLFQATGYAVHPYPGPTRLPPNVVVSTSPDFANLAALPNLEKTLQAATGAYGQARRFPLYDTEYGYITDPPYGPGAPVALAAAYENWAEYISWRYPPMRSWDQYLLIDPPSGGPSAFDTGLEFASDTPKPTYDAFRMPIYIPVTHAKRGSVVEVWGCVRPAHYAQLDTGQPQRVQIELQPSGGGRFQVVKVVAITDPGGYFDTSVQFPGSGIVRLSWSYPHGPTVHSRDVAVTVS